MRNATLSRFCVFVKRGTRTLLKTLPFYTVLSFLCLNAPPALSDAKTVLVGVYENEPKIFTARDGTPSGICIDVIEYIARREGWKIRYVGGTWSEGLARLARGEIDVMPDVAYTAERGRLFGFHAVPVLFSWSQVYAGKGNRIQSILDLDKKKIVVLDGSVQQASFERFISGFGLTITLIKAPDYKTMFETVARGDAHAAVTNRFFGLLYAGKYGLDDTAVLFDPSNIFFAVTVNDPRQLLASIDKHLSELKKDPQSVYYKSLKRWTSEEVKFKFPAWLRIFGLIVAVALPASIVLTVILKYQVNARTMELKTINLEMEQRIIDRTRELAVAMERAEAADRIKSAFLATMSHELRTPLNSIIGFTGVILQGLAGPLNEEQKKQLGMVKNSARHLLSLINDVLDISKIEAGQLGINAEPFDLRASIEKVSSSIMPAAVKKGLGLYVSIGGEIGEAVCDCRRVEQVILNLLSNAVKYTERGSVSLSADIITDYLPRSEDSMSKPVPAARITITDTGIGMRPDEIKDIFQPFRQIDTGLSRKNEGTGLGLAICRRLADLMYGEVTVESEWGHGSVFTFIFPLEVRRYR